MAKSDRIQIILQNGKARKEKPYHLNVWIREDIRLRKVRQTTQAQHICQAVLVKLNVFTICLEVNMSNLNVKGNGTRENPWILLTPPGSSEFIAFRDETLAVPALVVRVGKTELQYHLRCIEDLHAMLKSKGDWILLGSADEQKSAQDGTVEAWGRSSENPVKGWYGLKKGLRGRFAMYVPPVMEVLGLAEVEHNPKNNRMRAV